MHAYACQQFMDAFCVSCIGTASRLFVPELPAVGSVPLTFVKPWYGIRSRRLAPMRGASAAVQAQEARDNKRRTQCAPSAATIPGLGGHGSPRQEGASHLGHGRYSCCADRERGMSDAASNFDLFGCPPLGCAGPQTAISPSQPAERGDSSNCPPPTFEIPGPRPTWCC